MLEEILHFKGTWRNYQQRVLDRYDCYSQDRKLHIVAAPGSGKTTLGIELIRRINQPTLILAPSITIREQWVERICEAFLVNQEDHDQYLSQDLKKPKLITVVTYQALHSAMTHYCGELVENNDEFRTVEEVDYHDFDVIHNFKEYQLGTLCLDECHHLRNEWWKSLEEFKKEFYNIFTVALTATPPFDSNLSMWTRYINMCGDIDEEITVPELVKDGTLCPHQDYVYFNYPSSQEKLKLNIFEENSKNILERLIQDEYFCNAIMSHRFFTEEVSDEELLEDPSYLSAIIIFLNAKGVSNANKYQKLLGYKSLDPLSLKWLEILLNGFLYDDISSYQVEEQYRDELIRELKSKGLIEKRKVSLCLNQAIEKMLINSVGKCESIKEIVNYEYKTMKQELRLLILTDYIRKEYERALGDESKDVNNLGVLPFFEQLRRDSAKNKTAIKLGVLCGSMIIIPKDAQTALIELVEEPSKISFHQVGILDDYVKVEVSGNRNFITGIISEMFAQGYMQVLIGTKSLLGEGWDSPCVNSLILASFVGSYMLSNQMRGRAIRVFEKMPNKTSNIWHLVCVKPKEKLMGHYDNGSSEDFQMLERRMEHFLGLHYQKDVIENGILRLSAIEFPFSSRNIKKINKEMLNLSSKRNQLKKRWEDSLAIYDKIDVIDETEVKEELITTVMFTDALRALLIIILGGILGAIIGMSLLKSLALTDIFKSLILLIYVVLFVMGTLLSIKKLYTLANPLSRLAIFGNGIRNALEKTNQLDSFNSRVETNSLNEMHTIYLLGGTGHDKALFAKCILEFFAPIDNQRYILYNPRRKNKLDGYFAIPDSFAQRKEEAHIFASYMKPFIGNYQVIYTRNESGRKILLKARISALANRQDRCFTRKKVKSALE
ncbi:MAG: DEAD/DEAH box helicase family protein [Erysipelotrichaceae bacterium]|nr:DEAD/DEAH box helicase family protein [Erysipelotrichaceae bacterium]